MKEKLLIDLDDTILVDAWKELTEEYLNKTIHLESLEPGTYVNSKLTTPEFISFVLERNLYDYGKLDSYVVDSIKELSKYYDVYIASIFVTPGMQEISSILAKRKIDFLNQYFSFLGEDKFLILGSKNILEVDISIGDSMSDQIGKKQNFLFTRYHNKHISNEELSKKNSIRVSSWKELMEYFEEKN